MTSLVATVGIIVVLGSPIAAIGERAFGMAARETWLYVFLVAFVGGVSIGYAVANISARWGRRA